jgi:hypothetical protein
MGRGRSAQTDIAIAASYDILKEIQPASVRAVCYRLFVRDLIPDMRKKSTNRISRILTGAREREEIPWEWIVDETRSEEGDASWANPESYAETVIRSYRRDYWQNQPFRVVVWSEKSTVSGTLAPVLNKYGVKFRPMHGYSSATIVRGIAVVAAEDERPLYPIYVGDLDPSGMHMSEVDLPGRLSRYGYATSVLRVALTLDDCTDKLPSFPAETKKDDKRYPWFVRNYGDTCWELDALDPRELRERVEAAIVPVLDPEAWARCQRVERAEHKSLVSIISAFRGLPENSQE